MVIKCILRNRAAAKSTLAIFERTTELSWCWASTSPAEGRCFFFLTSSHTMAVSDVEDAFDEEARGPEGPLGWE